MQRLFSMFPTGLPGLALLLLRGSVAIAVVVASYRPDSPGWLQAAALLLAVALLAGYLTPIVAIVALVIQGFVWSNFGLDSTTWAAIISMNAIGLALVGPGAYSIDAYLFGRRVVVS